MENVQNGLFTAARPLAGLAEGLATESEADDLGLAVGQLGAAEHFIPFFLK